MIGLCVASGTLSAFIATSAFTLGWTHSIEKVRWEEDWIVGTAAPEPRLVLARARVHGSGAGMEPPDDAQLIDGVWHYPVGLSLDRVVLTHSRFAAGYTLCVQDRCQPLSEVLEGLSATPDEAATIVLSACAAD